MLAVADDLERLVAGLQQTYPDERFIAIVAADDGADLAALLEPLTPVVAEMIFTASSSPLAREGMALAWQALDELGVGQDFVYTVPRLAAAIAYACAVLAAEPRHGWDGTAVLVAGSAATVEEARRAVAAL